MNNICYKNSLGRELTDEAIIRVSYVGDLTVSLTSPDGKTIVLHNEEGENSDDLKITYTKENSGIDDFVGDEIAGDWSLHVIDHEFVDVGRLNSWKIELDFEPAEQLSEVTASPNAQIPDARSDGIVSTITISDAGKLKAISVQVRISHSYIGDLYVDLVSPSGQSVVLHNRTGRSDRDLRITYDGTNAPALDLLIDDRIKGDWKLRVRDLERQDVGTLEDWTLKIWHVS